MDVAGIEEGMDVIYGLIIPTPSWDHMIMIMGSLRIALKIQSLSLSVNAFLQICLSDFSLTNSPMIRDIWQDEKVRLLVQCSWMVRRVPPILGHFIEVETIPWIPTAPSHLTSHLYWNLNDTICALQGSNFWIWYFESTFGISMWKVDGVPRKINIEVLTTQFGSERLRSDVKTTKPR